MKLLGVQFYLNIIETNVIVKKNYIGQKKHQPIGML